MRGTPRNNKSTRPAASCFHLFFGRFGNPDETLILVFIYFFKSMAQRTFSFPALCFASDDPRTSCLFTNTAHLIRYVLTCRHTLLYKDLFSLITHLKPVGGGGGGGGIPGNLWWGCAARLSKSWSYFRPKKVIFHTRRQTCRKQKLCYHYLD